MVSGRKAVVDFSKMGFARVDVTNGGVTKRGSKCLVCEKVFIGSDKKRLIQYKAVCDQLNTSDSANTQPSTSRQSMKRPSSNIIDTDSYDRIKKHTKQTDLSGFVDNLGMNEEQIHQAKVALAEFFYANNISFRTVENHYFKNFIQILNPAFVKHLPNRKHLAGDLLDKLVEKCIQQDKESIKRNSVLLVDGWTNGVTQTEWTASLIHNSDGSTGFIDAAELEIKTAVELSKAVADAAAISEARYSSTIYAFETDNATAMVAAGNNMKHSLWHFRCNAHTANLLVLDLIEKSLEKKVNTVQVFFKANFRRDQQRRGAARVILPSRTRWCYYL